MPRISPCRGHHEEILASLRRGEPGKAIATRLGISYRALASYMRRKTDGIRSICPHGYRWSDLDEDDLRRRIADGQTHWQIAEALGVSMATIQRRCNHLDLETSRTGPRSGRDHPEWTQGRHLDKHGYVTVWVPLHPNARRNGHVFEHRLLMEVVLGRYLTMEEVVHHFDDHPRHNWPDNLGIFSDNGTHLKHELTGRPQRSPRSSTPGAYSNSQRRIPCPGESETLAQCPSETRHRLVQHIEIHRPTSAHRTMSRREFRATGATVHPFQWLSTDSSSG